MVYELVIDEGKEKPIINFLKQLDFVTVKAVKKQSEKKVAKKTSKNNEGDLSYFDSCPDWNMDVADMRKKTTSKRIDGWL